MTCDHERLVPEVIDQTLGVKCLTCDAVICCWSDEHVSERMWNRACINSKNSVRCVLNRTNVCFLCGEHFENT
jgi:hypothetical protein